jgi:hypothetical protein
MAAINAPEAGPADYAAFRDASLSQLEAFTAEARALTTERIALIGQQCHRAEVQGGYRREADRPKRPPRCPSPLH